MPPQHSRLVYGRAQRHVSIARLIPSRLSLSLSLPPAPPSPPSLASLSLPHPPPNATHTGLPNMTRALGVQAFGELRRFICTRAPLPTSSCWEQTCAIGHWYRANQWTVLRKPPCGRDIGSALSRSLSPSRARSLSLFLLLASLSLSMFLARALALCPSPSLTCSLSVPRQLSLCFSPRDLSLMHPTRPCQRPVNLARDSRFRLLALFE